MVAPAGLTDKDGPRHHMRHRPHGALQHPPVDLVQGKLPTQQFARQRDEPLLEGQPGLSHACRPDPATLRGGWGRPYSGLCCGG